MKRKRDERRTYTKKAVKSLLIVGVLNAEIPYLLAYLGREPVRRAGDRMDYGDCGRDPGIFMQGVF